MPAHVGAIDLGGTKIFAAVVDEHGRILASDRRPTEPEEGVDAVVARMVASLAAAVAGAGVPLSSLSALGIAAPGPIDAARGVVSDAPNLAGWVEVPLAARLQSATRLRTVLENDANASALGEHRFGAGRGANDMVYLTVSTGIGGGLIIGGQLFRGASGSAGEIGHMVLDPDGPRCGCGHRGCLEALASGTALARMAKEAAEGGSAGLRQLAEEWGGFSAEMVADAAERGDEAALEILAAAARYLGLGLVNLAHLLNPSLIVIGGGASKIGPPLIGRAVEYLQKNAFAVISRALSVKFAENGDESAVLGAAALALQAR